MDLETLARFAPFAGLVPELLAPLVPDLTLCEVPADTQLFLQGAPVEELFLILDGHVEGSFRDAEDGLEYAGLRAGPGDHVGLAEVLLSATHAQTVRTTVPSRLLSLPRDAILASCVCDPGLGVSLYRALAERLHLHLGLVPTRFVDLALLHADESLWSLLPVQQLQKFRCLPLALNGRVLVVGFVDPSDLTAVDDVSRLLRTYRVRPVTLEATEFDRFLRTRVLPKIAELRPEEGQRDRWFQHISQKASTVQLVENVASASPEEKGKQVSGEVIIAMVNRLIGEALELGASDIHVEPSEHELTVRYRVDGRLRKRPESLEPRFHSPLVSRLKALGRMDIAEKRRAQDGRLTVAHGNRQIDFRLSTMPTRFGEKIVLRILDPTTILIDLERLVVHEPTYRSLRWMLEQQQGLVIVAGPTGSGKTTTIYSALLRLREDEINIVTIEDPIEYTIEGLTQVQVNDAAGVSFSTAIRHFLRQDPDVIVVGETRDPQTAATTVEAALTGHLVFTSLHANDALGAVVRLREMGIEQFLLAHTVLGVVSQRLLRRVCTYCREPASYHRDLIEPLGVFSREESQGAFSFFRGRGCVNCNFQGYRGRVGAFEVLRIDDRLRPAIATGVNMTEVARIAREAGLLQPMRDNCRHLLEIGLTTPEEVARVLFIER